MGSLLTSVLCILVLQSMIEAVLSSPTTWSDSQLVIGPRSGQQTCRNDMYMCRHNGVCISGNRRCDNFNDCAVYHDDEDNCVCSSNQIQCLNGTCIDRETCRCNGYWECHNGEDELHCSECPADKFKCSPDGNCIPSDLRCNGVNDCLDESDESGCPLSQSDHKDRKKLDEEILEGALRDLLAELQRTMSRNRH